MTGEDGIRRAAAAAEPVEPERLQPDDGCPIVCLGHRDGVYHYLSPSGEHRQLRDRDHTRNGLMSLFDGDRDWFFDLAGDGESNKWSLEKVAATLMRRCAAAGLWRNDTAFRGIGVWKDKDEGLIVHCGDRLWIDGDWQRAGLRTESAVYAAQPPIARPDFREPATLDDGARLLSIFRRWRFRRPESGPHLALGYVGQGGLGGAVPWQAHIAIEAERGAGKTRLMHGLMKGVLGDQAEYMKSYSEAGLRASLSSKARAVLLDEAEEDAKGESSFLGPVIELLRRMSEGEGATIIRGAPGGEERRTIVTGSICMGSILGAPLLPQDRSRITTIDLQPLLLPASSEEAQAIAAELAADLEWVRDMSPRFRARLILRYDQYLGCFGSYRAALIGAGCDWRQAEQFASLMAGRDLFLADAALTIDEASQAIGGLMPMIDDAVEIDRGEGTGMLCLGRIVTSEAKAWQSGEQRTIGRLIVDARVERRDGHQRLGAYGLRLDLAGDRTPALLVANNHVALERIFAGTPWAGGLWRKALLKLQGAAVHPNSVQFDGWKSRCIRIPVEHLPDKEDPPDRSELGPDAL